MQINYKNYKLMYGMHRRFGNMYKKRRARKNVPYVYVTRLELSSRIQEKKYTVYFRKKNPQKYEYYFKNACNWALLLIKISAVLEMCMVKSYIHSNNLQHVVMRLKWKVHTFPQ